MKIKLTQDGFEGYTGQMGVHFFENGVSTADVTLRDAARMSAVMNCEYEDGSSCSPSQRILDTKSFEADSTRDTFDEPAPNAAPAPAPAPDVLAKVDVDPNKPAEGAAPAESSGPAADTDTTTEELPKTIVDAGGSLWTAEELGQVADKDGIAGLRAIADPLNVKSNSIPKLITALIAANAKKV